jgi:hypothetical protein
MADLDDVVGDIEDVLGETADSVGTNTGPLADPPLAAVAANLETAQSQIATALAMINGVGTANTSSLPSTLPAIASQCQVLARDAHDASAGNPVDKVLIGNKLKTIDWLIDVTNGYRDKAGIS